MKTQSSTHNDAKLRERPAKGLLGQKEKHDSARKHVTGEAKYVDDMPEIIGTLYMAVGCSELPYADILELDLSDVTFSPGVVDVISFKNIPGETDIGPVFKGDPLFADKQVEYVGQALFAVVAQSYTQAKKAIQQAKVKYLPLEPVLTIEQALNKNFHVLPEHVMQKGDVKNALLQAEHIIENDVYIKGQDHFYLETQVSYVVPGEDKSMMVYTSSQHPSEVQKLVAEVLDLSINHVQVEVRRMGGGFGGKETQAAPWACMAAIFASRLKCPIKARLDRQDDMKMTGKRHDFLNRYKAGIDKEGKILGVNIKLAAKCGYSPDLSNAIVDRAMFHSDNAYHYPAAHVRGIRSKTHTVSNTAFRGFGGPQGMTIAEYLIDDIARKVQKDPLDVRKINLYKNGDSTHYGQVIENYDMLDIIETLEQDCDYRKRRQSIHKFNKEHHYIKKGIALTPVKFGISFTAQHLNQAGALIHIYTDGSIHVNHGGTEMGQGLYTKVAQVVASEFNVDIETIQVSSARTDKVPNTSPTAASSGSDLNGKAAQNACLTIKERLVAFACEKFSVEPDQVEFINNHVQITHSEWNKAFIFQEFIQLAYEHRISLSASGYYKTPKIFYDREKSQGRPFFYYALGAACSEVVVDVFTGEYKVTRTDILHDVGQSMNPAIDIGQIEGGFIQGMGWLTTEELTWDEEGRVVSNSPANYKIPTVADIPEIFNVNLFKRPNEESTIYFSKAVGEPPLMLGISVWMALRDACASLADYQWAPRLNTPATPENVLFAMEQARRYKGA